MISATATMARTRFRSAFPSGVATVGQLVTFGVPERTVYHRCLEGGPWQRILPGIVLLFTGRPARDQIVRAALLLGGPDAIVTGLEACRRHGLRRGPAKPDERREPTAEVHVLVPATRQVRSVEFVHVERTKRLPRPLQRDGVPLAPIARACIDAARRIRCAGDIAELLSDPVQRGLCTVSALGNEVATCSRRGTALPRAVLADLGQGVRSAAEREAKKLWARTGLPEPWWNAAVYGENGTFLGVADCWVDDVAMVWEIESTEWHLSPREHDRSVERAARFAAAGAAYLPSKPKKLRSDGEGVIRDLRATYRHARARPRPTFRAIRASDHIAGKPLSRNQLA